MNKKITNALLDLSNKSRLITVIISLYTVLLIIYDCMKNQRPLEDVIISYVCVILVCVFVWFGVRLVLFVQIKNPMCSEKILNIFSVIALAVFAISTVVLGIEYFAGGFLVAAFVSPIAFLSIVCVQKLRK